MSTPLSAGNFFILNTDSSRYILADSFAAIGDNVKTTDTDASADNNRISVSVDDKTGLYTFQRLDTVNTPSKGLYLASGNDATSGNPIVVWSGLAYSWQVTNCGPGVWDINAPGANSYWIDSKSAKDHTIELLTKASQGSRVQWQLIAA
jgi:hypothetical protein